VTLCKGKKLTIKIYFKKDIKNNTDISDYIKNLMKESRYLYARLCFAITQNMVGLLKGKYSALSQNDGINILKIEI
ncbi:MAG: hypothetical protein P8078_07565, partial [bacterium]